MVLTSKKTFKMCELKIINSKGIIEIPIYITSGGFNFEPKSTLIYQKLHRKEECGVLS